jgi:hypothetical protein
MTAANPHGSTSGAVRVPGEVPDPSAPVTRAELDEAVQSLQFQIDHVVDLVQTHRDRRVHRINLDPSGDPSVTEQPGTWVFDGTKIEYVEQRNLSNE